MPTKDKNEFLHPQHGKCKRESSYVAIRWWDTAADEEKSQLLTRLQLSHVEQPTPKEIKSDQRKLVEINNTKGLSWVERKGLAAITEKIFGELEKSDFVQWVAPAFRAEKSTGLESIFTINPKRLYLSAPVANSLGDLTKIGEGITLDSSRTERLHGLVCLNVQDAIETAEELRKKLEKTSMAERIRGIRFENIPLISPTTDCGCGGTITACKATPTEFLPNDPLFTISWGLRRINAPYAWSVSRGEPNITIAVIDQGVELAHPDLNLHPLSWNASTDLPDGSPTGNHGTACAGIVAATINNSLGACGVAGNCRVMAIATATWADIDIAEGLYFATDNGAKVVSMSFGQYAWWGIWDFDLIRDALQYANDKDLVLVAASGNENGPVSRFPGSDSRTICVGGSNREDQRKRIGDASSNPLWGASFGPDLDMVGPCLEIPTTDRLGAFGYAPTDYYNFFDGTSSATPHVAGLAALIRSIRTDLTNEEVREIIERTCDKISPSLYLYALVGSKPNGTWNQETGYGRINAERAITLACTYGLTKKIGPCEVPSICYPQIPAECIAPPAPPWMPFDQCIYWYEPRFIGDREIQIRVVYQHCLRLLGRKQGSLLYTTTLLPGETVRLYHYDRYRRVRSATQRMTVHTSFRQAVSALWQTRLTQEEKKYQDFLIKVRSEDDGNISVGGQLFPVTFEFEDPETFVSDAQGASITSVSDSFQQIVTSASQQVDAERSVVISNFEEAETQNVTVRTIENKNHCRAVTYFVRRVLEVYELHTTVREITWRTREQKLRQYGQFRSVTELRNVQDNIGKRVSEFVKVLPNIGQELRASMQITLPTDGVLYEAELAHCSSCEPARQIEVELVLEKAKTEVRRLCLETELLAMEVQRRKALLDKGQLESFEKTLSTIIPN